jgi:uncharacterized membrane protein
MKSLCGPGARLPVSDLMSHCYERRDHVAQFVNPRAGPFRLSWTSASLAIIIVPSNRYHAYHVPGAFRTLTDNKLITALPRQAPAGTQPPSLTSRL